MDLERNFWLEYRKFKQLAAKLGGIVEIRDGYIPFCNGKDMLPVMVFRNADGQEHREDGPTAG